ncbi:hypothetical protein MMC16_007733 [Acarospora aff. strigata]|nr:hypothetical protein [Acarospora aff. strigata]
MSESKLDQIVKGAPRPAPDPQLATLPTPQPASPLPLIGTRPVLPAALSFSSSDPTSTLPSSPPQIYLNLLILEASLRSQYLTLRARRRQHTFFILILTLWTTYFCYALFLRPREDGSGVGGSVYWMVEVAEKLALMGGMVTGILLWGTGQWERGVRWPRRWVGIANRGLRVMNTKIVVIKGSWWREVLSQLSFLFPHSSFFPLPGSSYQCVDYDSEKDIRYDSTYGKSHTENPTREEDLAPGGDYIKLLLLPKPFSPDFRENWELYRAEYWEKENERRAQLRQRVMRKHRELAREQSGWIWWTGWRGWTRAKGKNRREGDVERTHRHHHHSEKESKRIASTESDFQPRPASRSSTRLQSTGEIRPTSERGRRGSSTSSGGDGQRKLRSSLPTSGAGLPRLTRLKSQGSDAIPLRSLTLTTNKVDSD